MNHIAPTTLRRIRSVQQVCASIGDEEKPGRALMQVQVARGLLARAEMELEKQLPPLEPTTPDAVAELRRLISLR